MPTFDEKYRHCCCHIRVAAYVIGVLELLSVLYILAQHSIRSIIADVQQSDSDKQSGASTPAPTSSTTKRWLGPGATTPLVTWAVCETLFLALMFYGIVRTRPWLLIPQLFMQIVTIVVCMILNILMICVLAWHPYVTDIWYFLASTVVFAFLYEYGLVVLIRCYRYLRDKAAYNSQTAHGVFVLPTRANGEVVVTANEESRMYSDLPPEYATAIAMMTVDEANKAATTAPSTTQPPSPSPSSTETKTETTTDSSCLRHDSKDAQEPESKEEEHRQPDENAPPPTYEQARQLQQARSSSVSTS